MQLFGVQHCVIITLQIITATTLRIMLKHLFVLLVAVISTSANGSDNFYGKTIYVEAGTQQLLKGVAEDLQQQLSKATGTVFTLSNNKSAQGIILSISSNSEAGNLPEACTIQSDGSTYLKISGASKQGLINGIYTYLHQLGFRWYQPGDAWTLVPTLKDITIKANELVQPDFELRSFFATFGTPRNPIIDKGNVVDKAWKEWMVRNRLGGETELKGHAAEGFRKRNKGTLDAHPEYYAMVKGERAYKGGATKYCASNTALQQLFVKDMVQQLREAMQKKPEAGVYAISAEPADGDGFCSCDNCKKLGAISEQVFLLANLAAKAFQSVSPKAFVNLYAYHTHTAPPTFSLEKNVIVAVAPYQFQRYAKPDEVIDQWLQKTNNIFIRDYFALPTHNSDMPLADAAVEKLQSKIIDWKKKGIKGVMLESSHSIGATGPGAYVYARLMWNADEKAGNILNEYYNYAFGAAANAVRQSQQISSEKSEEACIQAMQLLQKQTSNVKLNANQQQCLSHYKAYLHYVKLYRTWKAMGKNVSEQATDQLLQYVWSMHFTMMIHTRAITEVLAKQEKIGEYIKQQWVMGKKNMPTATYQNIKLISNEVIEKQFAADCAGK